MKKNLLLLLSLLLSTTLFAKHVDKEAAGRAGINFFFQRASLYKSLNYQDLRITGTFVTTENAVSVYYVFNIDGGGWVVVSAEDDVTPVLAYSFEGSYSTDNQPPQFISWMDGYAKQIGFTIDNNLQAGDDIHQQWERLMTTDPSTLTDKATLNEVTPLLISTWDQGTHYNLLCPADGAGPGGHVWAGCVATAMCQVMYYYRFPNTGNGEHCYTPWGYEEQCADFGATNYRWNEMVNALNNSQYNDTATAELLWHAGISVNMMYSPDGSGAYSEDAAAAMINNFRYVTNTQLLEKSNYSESAWAGILRDNLDKKRPMYYDGYGTGGHAFNVDGYQGTDYFHFNWGWSGSYNGYFYLNNLNPGGNNFTNGQGAIVNLYPDTLSNIYPNYCNGQTILHALSGTFEDGGGPTKDYLPNSSCSWLIDPQNISDSVTGITLTFSKFNTEAGNDILRIYQGGTTSDVLLGEYSGDNIPPSVTVAGNKALITFTTNNSIQKPGWFITYISETMDWCQGTQILTEPEGTISDGSLNFNYKNSSNCRWRISPEGTGPIMLTITSFNTETLHDVLRIYDLGSEEMIGEISGEYAAGNMPGPFTANSGRMFIMFTTNQTVTGLGWEGYYTTFPVGCKEANELSAIQIFPNPATEFVTVSGKALKMDNLNIEMLNMEGKTLMKDEMIINDGSLLQKIDLHGIPKGVYILKIVSDNEVTLKKLLVQ